MSAYSTAISGNGGQVVGTFEDAKMVACKWQWVLAGQVGVSYQFEQVWCCIMHN